MLERVKVWFGRLTLVDWLTGTFLVMVAGAALAHTRRYAGVIIDDAFITFRYSLNLVQGHGLTYNVGEHVEGTSSPLFALAMAVPIAAGADPFRAATALSGLAFVGCCVATYLAVQVGLRERWSRLIGLGASATVAASSTLAFHCQTGMETLLYTSLLTLATWLHLRTLLGGQPSSAWAAVMGLAALARPEGIAYFVFFFGSAVLRRLRAGNAKVVAIREVGAFSAVYLPWLVFRVVYYGRWVPNSVIAKSGTIGRLVHGGAGGLIDAVTRGPGTQALQRYIDGHLLAVALVAGMLLLPRSRYCGLLVVGVVLGSAALLTCNGGDWMPYDRLFAPCIPLLTVGTALGLGALLFHEEQASRFGHAPSLLVSVLAWVFIAHAAFSPLSIERISIVDEHKMRQVGMTLASLSHGGDAVASDMAGVLPYYWGIRTIDMYGLCDRHIASSGEPQPLGTGKNDAAYVVAQRPTFYAFNFANRAAAFYETPQFAQHRREYYLLQFRYGFFGSFSSSPPTIFVRKDRPEIRRLAETFQARLVDPGEELRRTGFLPLPGV